MFPKARKKRFNPAIFTNSIILMTGSLFLYVIQDSLVKSLPASYSTFEIIFFRSIFSFIPILFFAYFEKERQQPLSGLLRTGFLPGHLLRAFTMFCSVGCYLTACRAIPLADAYTLSYTSPLFMTLLAAPLLKEHVGLKRYLAVIVGFLGVMMVLRPGGDCFQSAGLIALCSGLFVAISAVWGRKLTFEDSNTLIVVMYTLMGLGLSAPFLPFVWVTPDLNSLWMLLLIGLTGGVAQYGFTEAYRLTPVTLLATFDYTGLLWAIPVGYWLWGDFPDFLSLMGMATIIAAGIYTITHAQAVHRKEGLKGVYQESLAKAEVS